MPKPGLVVEVVVRSQGSQVKGDHTAGDTSVLVQDASPFQEDDAQVRIDGVTYDCTAVEEVPDADDEGQANGLLTIDPGLADDVLDSTPVDLPLGDQSLDDVLLVLGDGGEVAVAARDRKDWSALEGPCEPPIPVTLSDDLTEVLDAPGVTLPIDLRAADPTYVPPAADGVAPAAPTLTVQSGPGFVFALIGPPTTNADGGPQADAVRYNIYGADTEAGVSVDPAKLVAQGPEVLKTLRAFLDGTSFDFEDIDGNPKPYFFAATAVDNDGESALSPVVSASMGKIDASAYVIAGTVTAALLQSVMSLTNLLTTRGLDADGNPTGQGLDFGTAPGQSPGLFFYDAAGNARLSLSNNPDEPFDFNGRVFADYIEAASAVLQTVSLVQGKKTTLQSAVTAPGAAPSTSIDFATKQFTDNGHWADRRGWATDGTYWYTARSDSGRVYVEQWQASLGTLAGFNSLIGHGDVHGCVVVGSVVYVLYYSSGWVLDGFRTSDLVRTQDVALTGTTAQMPDGTTRGVALGYDSAAGEFLLAQSRATNSDKVRVRRFSWNGVASSVTWSATAAVDSSFAYPYDLMTILYGSFDLGASRYIFGRGTSDDFQVINTSGTLQTGEQWNANLPNGLRGMFWDGTNFIAVTAGGLVQTYEAGDGNRWTDPDDATWYPSYNWTGPSSAHTPVGSDIPALTMKKRGRLTITAADLPPGVTGVDVYLAKGSTPPTSVSSSMKKQASATGSPPTFIITDADFGAADNPTTNTFGAGTPHEVLSQAVDGSSNPLVSLEGDGAWRLGVAAGNPDGTPVVGQAPLVTYWNATLGSNVGSIGTTQVFLTQVTIPAVSGAKYRVFVQGDSQNTASGNLTTHRVRTGGTSSGTDGTLVKGTSTDHRSAATPVGWSLVTTFTAGSTGNLLVKLMAFSSAGTSTVLAGTEMYVERVST